MKIEEIYLDLKNGISIRKIATKHNVSIKKVRHIKNNAKVYINLKTERECISTKSIPMEKQIFHLILQYTKLKTKDLQDIVSWSVRSMYRWECDECRLVEPSTYNNRYELLEEYMKMTPKQRTINISKECGIYMLYKSDSLQYVGKTINLQQRMLQHSHQSHVEGLEGNYSVKFINIPNNIDLDIAERILITYLKPPLNKMMYTEENVGGLFSDTLELIPNEYSFEIDVK